VAANRSPNDATAGGSATALAAMLQQLFAAEALEDVRQAIAHGAHVLTTYDTLTIREFLPGGALQATLRNGAPLGLEARELERLLRRAAIARGRTVSTLDRLGEEEVDALAAAYRLHAGLCLVRPLRAYGKPVGVVCLHFTGRTTLPDAAFDALRKYCVSAAVALANAHLRAGLLDLAYTDPLTGLPNRRRLEDELEALQGTEASIVLVDFDGLKQVNDNLDYERGDDLISQVGAMLRGCVRPGELAVRLGGDEFVVLLPDTPAASARARAEEIGTALDSLEVADDIRPYFRGASVGCGTAARDEDLSVVLRRAAAEMRARKRRRKTDVAARSERSP
jgi:diguanylate cyclase (GGDEF)-like protein